MEKAKAIRKIVLLLVSFQILYMGGILLLEKWFEGLYLLIGYSLLFIVLYLYHFTEFKLLQKLFSHMNLPYCQKYRNFLQQKLSQFSKQVQAQSNLLYILFFLTCLSFAISFVLLSCTSILLIEIYWLTEVSFGSSFCPILWGFLAILAKLVWVSFSFATTTKETK